MVLTLGYVLAAIGPSAVGALHELTGGGTAGMVLLLGPAAGELVTGLAASRAGKVGEPR